MRTAIVWSAVLLTLAAPPSARADNGDEARAKALFERATQQLDRGDLAGALDDYRAAYELVPRAKILLNIGAVLLELGRKVEAANTFADYLLRDYVDQQRANAVREQLTALDLELGRISIEITAESYRAVLDDDVLGMSPLQIVRRVAPGKHVVVLTRGDGSGQRYPLTAVAGDVHRLVVTPGDVVDTPAAPKAPGDVTEAGDPRSAGAAEMGTTRTGSRADALQLARQPWLWSAVVGVGAATAGAVFGLSSRSLEADIERLNANSGSHTCAEARELEDRARSRALVANVSFAVAGIAAATSAVLLVRERRKGPEPRLRARAGPIRGGGGFVVEVVF